MAAIVAEGQQRLQAIRDQSPPRFIDYLCCLQEGSLLVREGDARTGVIVGTATITHCTRDNGHYVWHLAGVKRLEQPRKPKRMPQPVWFKPF